MNLHGDYGCFFMQFKQTRDVGFIIYIKTNYLLKHHPQAKLNYFDTDKGQMLTKPHSPNKVWYIGFSGKNVVGGESLQDVTIKEFQRLFSNNVEKIYDYSDYPSSDELYTVMKDSKVGIPASFTKKWFEKQYKFIEKQYSSLSKK